jgi:uncharacterized protein (TIGR02678 family)
MKEMTPVEARGASERRRALRALLSSPLVLARREPEIFAAIVRHRSELCRWFADLAGWTLVVAPAAGHARLMKRAARRDATRPARSPGKGAFDRRRYTLFCLALAALDRAGAQVTLARLAEAVRDASLEEPELVSFDRDASAERHAFVDVLRLLAELGVLTLRDGDAEGYARGRDGADALYDVQERLLGQLISAPVPPALAGSPERMAEEERAQSEEGERIRARQTIFRMLLDDPVVYLDDLDARSREWLGHGSGFAYERLEDDAGLLVERRKEGLASVDPEGTLTDIAFPEGNSTVKHAALLLCEWLSDRARTCQPSASSDLRAPPVPWSEVTTRLTALRADCGEAWSKEYGGPDGDARLARDGVAVLEAFGLAVRSEAGVAARPAAARFAPAPLTR